MLSVLLVVSLFCKDVWGSNIDGCRDLDAGKVYDTDGRSCDFYDAKPDQCGLFDDPDFNAIPLCCACGGGERGTSSSTTQFRGTRPPRQTNPNTTPNRHTTAPPRDEPRGGIDTTRANQQGPRTRAPRDQNPQTGSTTHLTRPTPPTPPKRTPVCAGFDEDEMKSANCDFASAKNCPDAMPGGIKKCPFDCALGFLPPGGDKTQLYMTCDDEGKWHANAKCVAPARPSLKITGNNITKVSGDCTGHAWEHAQDISRCATTSGQIGVELWIAVGVVFLLIIMLIVGIICCVKKTNSANYSGSLAIQLGSSPSRKGYDWSMNPEKYEKM